MKVIFVIVSMSGGGAERVISILANQFAKSGLDVCIVMTAGDEVAYELDERIELRSMGGTSGGSLKKRIQRVHNMRKVFKENRNSIIISFGPGTSFFTVVADLFLHHHLIMSERSDPAACGHPFLRNCVYAQAKNIVFQTKEAKGCFPSYIQKKGVVIANPISGNIPNVSMAQREKTIVAVGRLEKEKNYPMLLHAFAMFHESHPEYTLHIYGEGSLKQELQIIAKELQISQCVVWEGFCKDVLYRIKDAGMYVLSSDYEGVSNALLEAMAMRLPVIATDCPIGGSAFCIQNDRNGLLVPVGNEKCMASAMTELADNRQKAEMLAEEAAKAREMFSEQKVAAMWRQLF